MKRQLTTALFALLATGTALAQETRSNRLASNGVQVDIDADEFAQRFEYSAPKLKPQDLDGIVYVAAIRRSGDITPVMVIGNLYYNGDWRRYDTAILRGGDEIEAKFGNHDVITCRGSRYAGCLLSEGFQLTPTVQQIRQYAGQWQDTDPTEGQRTASCHAQCACFIL